MEIFVNSSNYITKLATQFQNNSINKENFNKNLIVTTLFTHFNLKKENKKYKKIKELQISTFQSFYKLEAKQEESEKKLISKIKDRISKKIVEESIKNDRQNLLNQLAAEKDIKVFAEQTYNSYISPNRISLSLNFQINKRQNYNKKYIPKSNLEIKYLNANLNERENRIITDNFIESPLYDDFNYADNNFNDSESESDNNKINEKKEIDEFTEMLDEKDEILFYDEKLCKNEKKPKMEEWIERYNRDDIVYDFQELKQRKNIGHGNSLYNTLHQSDLIKKELELYLKNSANQYEQISKQEHYHEFVGYLSEKSYKAYIKKMNYSYLILMLLSYFDFEKFSNKFYEVMEEKKILSIFLKTMILDAGLSCTKIFDAIVHTALTLKEEELSFEDYLNCFTPIFNLSEKFQFYKYIFLLFLVKKSEKNIISLNNYRIFCNLIRGKIIYEADTCDDIISKLLPLIKSFYPKDDTEELNYQHVSIILEFLVNYEYGD
jgi:hypothetical protein